eukprot:231598-Pelagomonas_calceolata.AAC.3
MKAPQLPTPKPGMGSSLSLSQPPLERSHHFHHRCHHMEVQAMKKINRWRPCVPLPYQKDAQAPCRSHTQLLRHASSHWAESLIPCPF